MIWVSQGFSNHIQIIIFIPHAIHGNDDFDELIMDGKAGKMHAVSYHLLKLVYDRVWALANSWAEICNQLVFNET